MLPWHILAIRFSAKGKLICCGYEKSLDSFNVKAQTSRKHVGHVTFNLRVQPQITLKHPDKVGSSVHSLTQVQNFNTFQQRAVFSYVIINVSTKGHFTNQLP